MTDRGAEDSQPTAQSILDLFERLSPRDQLDRLMLVVGMPFQHWPPRTLELSHRQIKFVEWAVAAGAAVMTKLDAALKECIRNGIKDIRNDKKRADKRTPHPKAPKASMRDAASELRKDRVLVQSCIETLAPAAGGLLPIAAQQTASWAERLHAQRLLLLSCVDPSTLSSVARTVPFHSLFADVEKLQVARQDSPTVWQILESRRPAPGVVVAYAVGESGERWMRTLPTDDFDLMSLRARLEHTLTWLLVLTTPETAKRAHFDLQGTWIEGQIDFIGPRLRSALGPASGDLVACTN